MSTHPVIAAPAVLAALLLPVAITAPAHAATVTVMAAPTTAAKPHHSRRWRHCHTKSRPCARHHAPADRRARVVRAAERYIGQPYVYGKLDCSSLTQRAYAAIGKRIPRTAAAQQRAAHPTRHPRPGDLVFWGSVAYHTAIYIGSGRVVVARHSGTRVQIQRIWGSPTYGSLLG